MKKSIAIFMITVLLLGCLAGCGDGDKSALNDDPRIKVVATVFPAYDCARAIGGDNINLSMLLSPETQSHGFEPTLQEIAEIQSSDVFVYIGGESESWVDTVLAQIDTSSITVVRLMDCISEDTAILVNDHDHEHSDACEHESDEYDEHIWTSPRNVMMMSEQLRYMLSSADPDNSNAYTAACAEYLMELTVLDNELLQLTSTAERNTLVFSEQFPFAYLARQYSLDYYAAFSGCSGENEVSLSTIASLIEIVNSKSIPIVFYTEFSDETVADTICEATGASKRLLHSCHNLTQEEFDTGTTYLELMYSNFEALREALN